MIYPLNLMSCSPSLKKLIQRDTGKSSRKAYPAKLRAERRPRKRISRICARTRLLLINPDEALYEQGSGMVSGYYKREADVYNLAGFISRALAMIIDIAIVSLIALLSVFAGLFIVYGFNFGAYGSGNITLPLYLVLFLLSSTYFVFLHGYGGKTAGKTLLGIKLINNEGEGVGLWEAFVRWIGYYISGVFLFAGFLWFLVDSECQTWHDKIAGTYVVKD